MGVRSDRRFRLDTDRDTVWAALTRVDDYREWWPWLREFDGSHFDTGARWQCVVSPRLPYTLRFAIQLVEVVPRERVHADIAGDLAGWAYLAVDDLDGDGTCVVRLVSDLHPCRGPLRVVDRYAPRLSRWGHDRLIDTGADQFRREALP